MLATITTSPPTGRRELGKGYRETLMLCNYHQEHGQPGQHPNHPQQAKHHLDNHSMQHRLCHQYGSGHKLAQSVALRCSTIGINE